MSACVRSRRVGLAPSCGFRAPARPMRDHTELNSCLQFRPEEKASHWLLCSH